MSVGTRIKELRENKKLTRSELADLLGITVGAISNYENEVSSPKESILFKIIETLECDANYLFQDAIKMTSMKNNVSLNEYKIIEKYRALDEYGKESVNITLERETYRVDEKNRLTSSEAGNGSSTRLINYYYRLASAGTGQILFDMPPTKRIEIPDTPEYQKADYAIGVNGDSMEPTYKDGDTLLVEMAEDVDVNDIGIFLVNEECFVKKLGADELVSLNENYPNIPLNESAKCMGKVIGKL